MKALLPVWASGGNCAKVLVREEEYRVRAKEHPESINQKTNREGNMKRITTMLGIYALLLTTGAPIIAQEQKDTQPKEKQSAVKAEETIIQVWGMGPATSTPAEKR